MHIFTNTEQIWNLCFYFYSGKRILCVLNEQWQLVSRCAPQGQWPKLRAVWSVLYIYLDVRNLCGTSWVSVYFSEVHAVLFAAVAVLGNGKKKTVWFVWYKTKNDCRTGGNPGEWICISDFSPSFFNLPRAITKEAVKPDQRDFFCTVHAARKTKTPLKSQMQRSPWHTRWIIQC